MAFATEPAFAQPASSEEQNRADAAAVSAQFEAGVDQIAESLGGDARYQNMSLDARKNLVEFVAGNMLFVLVHERGHALVTEMGLPVLGREEDAADSHAILTMLRVGTTVSHRVLAEAAKGWFLSDLRDKNEGLKLAFYDEHGLDQQRAFMIVCLMVGSDPEKFKDLADETKLPEDRQGSCQGDYSNASWSWDLVLKPHRRAADQPKTKIEIVYGEGKGSLAPFAKSARTLGLLEIVANRSAQDYIWRAPFTLEMQTCGSSNSHWDVSTHKLTLCYEMAAEFADLYRDYADNPISVTPRRSVNIRLALLGAFGAALLGYCFGYFHRMHSRAHRSAAGEHLEEKHMAEKIA